ncbi:hypothetical protein CsSME_00046817 [Camellia sinensis var. sinensis]
MVKREEQDDSFTLPYNSDSIPLPKNVSQSPSLLDSTAKENQNDSLPSGDKIPKPYVPKLSMTLFPLSKGPKKNSRHTRELQEDTKLPISSSSIPRPRAVVSSPDNDKMIGNQNKVISKRPLALKKQSLEQYSTSQVNAIHDKAASPLSMRLNTREATQSKSDRKQCNSTKPAVSTQKRSITLQGETKLHDDLNMK